MMLFGAIASLVIFLGCGAFLFTIWEVVIIIIIDSIIIITRPWPAFGRLGLDGVSVCLSVCNEKVTTSWIVQLDGHFFVTDRHTTLHHYIHIVIFNNLQQSSSTQDWSFFDAFYFCFVTMTTIGFGDMTPSISGTGV